MMNYVLLAVLCSLLACTVVGMVVIVSALWLDRFVEVSEKYNQRAMSEYFKNHKFLLKVVKRVFLCKYDEINILLSMVENVEDEEA